MPERPDSEKLDAMPRSTRVRTFDADGYHWTVREVPAPAFDRRGGSHLVFDAEVVMRRVRLFPSDWFDLTDTALYALTAHA